AGAMPDARFVGVRRFTPRPVPGAEAEPWRFRAVGGNAGAFLARNLSSLPPARGACEASGGLALARGHDGDELAAVPPPERERHDLRAWVPHRRVDVSAVPHRLTVHAEEQVLGANARRLRRRAGAHAEDANRLGLTGGGRQLRRELLAPGGDAEVAPFHLSAA